MSLEHSLLRTLCLRDGRNLAIQLEMCIFVKAPPRRGPATEATPKIAPKMPWNIISHVAIGLKF